jgi:CheY-like chemotaxis protein
LLREHRTAINALVEYMWQHFNLEHFSLDQGTDAHSSVVQSQKSSATLDRELSWVKELAPKEPVDLNQVLSSVVDLVGNLAEHYDVALQISVPHALPDLAVHPTALRQVFISLLTIAIHRSAGGHVHVLVEPLPTEALSTRARPMEVLVHIQGIPAHPPVKTGSNEDDSIGVEIAQSLVDIWGGQLTFPSDAPGFQATINLPILACVPVLVVDDNMDTLQLLQRYASGSRYRIVGTQDPHEVFQLAKGISPQIIVTDVMMPEIDGWELLGHLRQHPLTACVPIVICTILPQKELALSVGADGFIQKPVSRKRFLSMLDQQMVQVAEKNDPQYE